MTNTIPAERSESIRKRVIKARAIDYQSALASAVNSPILVRHIAGAINYRTLDRSDYGTSF